jgi:enterochelin esterase-like enzyme/predicted RNA-binding Zn-ribbon protein involved in translation (DUF1610 family)
MSSATFESEGIRQMTVFSAALRGRGDISFACPPAQVVHPNLPIVILLHGVYGSHWSWFQQGGAHRVAASMYQAGTSDPFVLACPSDGLSREGTCYLSLEDGNYEQWVLDVPELIRAAVPACTALSPVFLCGLSMGGYGSLRLGTKHPERFAGISAHSPVTEPEMFRSVFSPEHADEILAQHCRDWEILTCAKDHLEKIPPLRFDCGVNDSFQPANERLHDGLTLLGVPHRYEVLPGGHDWSYWNSNLPRSLSFFTRVLRDLGGDENESIAAHVCKSCGAAIERAAIAPEALISGVIPCPKCGHESSLNLEIIGPSGRRPPGRATKQTS